MKTFGNTIRNPKNVPMAGDKCEIHTKKGVIIAYFAYEKDGMSYFHKNKQVASDKYISLLARKPVGFTNYSNFVKVDEIIKN